MDAAYVLCILGESPSILSNLLWWISTAEGRPIAGIEVWATGRGAQRLVDLTTLGGWGRLQAATGPLPTPRTGAEPASGYGFRVHCHQLDGRVLDDVRSAEEAAAVNATLHDRVRTLRHELPADIQLIGCLAGGRKTVSAAMQTAFCLQGRATDRLVHVVFEEAMEEALRMAGRHAEYVFPEPTWEELSGVARQDQIVVYDVPYPRLRYLVPRRLAEALETRPWAEVWPTLEANMGRDARAVLFRRGLQSWTYEIRDAASDELLYHTALKRRLGATMAALATATSGATALDLVAWLDTNDMGWAPQPATGVDADDIRAGAMRSAISGLRRALEDLPIGLEAFAPDPQHFVMDRVALEQEWPG